MLNNENELILEYEIISENFYAHLIRAEEIEKRELKGYILEVVFQRFSLKYYC